MTFERWRLLLEAVGLTAVVCSIVFLTLEVRQNTQAMRAAAIQESTNVTRQQLLTLATNVELSELLIADFRELDEAQRQRIFWADRSAWIGFQGLFRQWQLGVLPEEDWSFWQRVICANYAWGQLPAYGRAELWPATRTTLQPEFIEVVESSCDGSRSEGVMAPTVR